MSEAASLAFALQACLLVKCMHGATPVQSAKHKDADMEKICFHAHDIVTEALVKRSIHMYVMTLLYER